MDYPELVNILIVEEDPAMTALIGAALDTANFRHTACPCDTTALFKLQTDHFDLIVFDVGTGGASAMELLTMLSGIEAPLVLLIDHQHQDGPLRGLQLGAADYLFKPFNTADMVRRLTALLERKARPGRPLQFHDIEVDLAARRVRQNGQAVAVTPKEFDLLALLIEHAGMALSRERILQAVWGYCVAGETRTVDIHIMQLRKKLNFHTKLKSVIKVGYRLDR